jgi:hypothetical protein
MRFSSIAAAGLTGLLAFVGAADAQKAKAPPKAQVEVKFATLAPDGSTWMKTMRKVDEEVRRRTENRVGLKFYPGGVQGDEKDVIRKMRNGQIHAAGFTGFGLGAIVPETRVLELPFMFESLEELDYVRGATNDYYEKAFKAKDYALLAWTDVGFVYLFTKSPVRKVSDMPNTKWWIWSGDQLAGRGVRVAPGVRGAPVVHPRQVHVRASHHARDQRGGRNGEVAGRGERSRPRDPARGDAARIGRADAEDARAKRRGRRGDQEGRRADRHYRRRYAPGLRHPRARRVERRRTGVVSARAAGPREVPACRLPQDPRGGVVDRLLELTAAASR